MKEAAVKKAVVEKRTGPIAELMARHGVTASEDEFLALVSNALHELEAPIYDGRHPEVALQVGPAFSEFLTDVVSSSDGRRLRILDVGCGTGFASELILDKIGGQVAELVCSDISPHMLERCRRKLAGRAAVRFVLGDVRLVAGQSRPFDLVVSCSVVHHIPHFHRFLGLVGDLVSTKGFYMMMHEPSSRFYKNPQVREPFDAFSRRRRYRRLARFVDPRTYGRWLGRRLGISKPALSLEEQTSRLLVSRRVTCSPLTAGEIRQLVDVHVPPIHDGSVALGLPGFDPHELASECLPQFTVRKFRSYGYFGTHFIENLPEYWQQRANEVAQKYPADGAQFCALLQKL